MPILTEQQARELVQSILKLSTADEIMITIRGSHTGNIRFARNTVSTTGDTSNLTITIVSVFGKRSGSASTNEYDKDALKRTIKMSEDIARLAPENSESMPLARPQQFAAAITWSDATAAIDPEFRAQAAFKSIEAAVNEDCTAAGYLEDYASFIAIGNNTGLFAYNKSTGGDFTITVRTPDEKGSGYARQSFTHAADLNTAKATHKAIQKARSSANVEELPPGKYTVILEPIATGDLIPLLTSAMDARSADEGRSYFGKRGQGNRIGEKLFSDLVTIYSDPFDTRSPSSTFTSEGLPVSKATWIEKGVLRNLPYSRYWAAQKNVQPLPRPDGIIMQGSDKSVEELIRGTEKGILVSHFWYIRPVSAQQLLYTGLTRDGVFYIENGRIKFPVKNFRFNESPANMLINLEALGVTERVGNHILPAMKIRDFNFTSISDAV